MKAGGDGGGTAALPRRVRWAPAAVHAAVRLARRLRRARAGIAAVEFAMVLPVLLLLYIGGYVITDMIGCNRKVTVATRELTDLATRYPELTSSQVSTILGASQQVLVPYDYTKSTVTLSEVQVIDATHVKVVWSQSLNGTARTAGASITVNPGLIASYLLPTSTTAQSICTTAVSLTGNGGCMMLGEVSYNYRPVMGLGAVTTTTLGDAIYLSPRVSSSIPLLS